MQRPSTTALLSGAVDYAGLVPPAGRTMAAAVAVATFNNALSRHRARVDTATAGLHHAVRGAYRLTAVRWGSERFPLSMLRDTRSHHLVSFGSCSFQEPVDEFDALASR
jgi:hypothetical protein